VRIKITRVIEADRERATIAAMLDATQKVTQVTRKRLFLNGYSPWEECETEGAQVTDDAQMLVPLDRSDTPPILLHSEFRCIGVAH
jgi:hypothetical protein